MTTDQAGSATCIKVREAVPGDAEQLAGLLDELGYQISAPSLQTQLAQFLADPETVVFAAESDQTITGVILVSIGKSLVEGRHGVIGNLVVRTTHRESGIGKRLVQEAIDWLARSDIKSLSVGSRPQREGARKFYERIGFSFTKTQNWFHLSIE